MKNDIIHEGMTNEYLIHGLSSLILGGLLGFIHPALFLLILPISIGLFCVSTGIEIDKQGLKMRKYKSIFGLRTGRWVNLKTWKKITLQLSIEHSTGGATTLVGVMPSVGKVRSYDLTLIGENGNKKQFTSFTKYSKALNTVKVLLKIPSVETVNSVEERMKFQRKNRRR